MGTINKAQAMRQSQVISTGQAIMKNMPGGNNSAAVSPMKNYTRDVESPAASTCAHNVPWPSNTGAVHFFKAGEKPMKPQSPVNVDWPSSKA